MSHLEDTVGDGGKEKEASTASLYEDAANATEFLQLCNYLLNHINTLLLLFIYFASVFTVVPLTDAILLQPLYTLHSSDIVRHMDMVPPTWDYKF